MATATDTAISDRLKATREQIQDARQRRATARTERDSAKEKFAQASHDGPVADWPEFAAATEAVAAEGRIADELADLQQSEASLLAMLGQGGAPDPGGNDRGSVAEVARLWDGHRLVKTEGSPFMLAQEAGVFTSTNKFGTISLGQIADRESMAEFLSAALPAATPGPVGRDNLVGATPADRRGIIQPLLRRLSLLDLIPTGTTDSPSVEYVQVIAVPGGAAEVVEGAVKPEGGLATIDATAPVRTIAGWVKLQRQALDDISGLGTLINTLLPYDVRRRLEGQILAGDGVGQNLRGILNTTGIGAPAFVTGDNAADAILRALTVVVLSDGDPNFAAANPLTWQDIMLMRETGTPTTARTGQYLAGGPFTSTAPTIWGLSLVPNRVVPELTPLVGDSMGCTLLVREGVNVKVSDSDQDDFTRNRITVLAEGRFAFPVWRPASFAVADYTP